MRRRGAARARVGGLRGLALGLCLGLLWGGLARPAAAEPALGPREAARALALRLRERLPALCQGPAHWLIGVDTSGSMAGKLDPAKAALDVSLRSLLADGDRLTLVRADHEVRRFPADRGSWEVGPERDLLAARFAEPLRIRPGGRGSRIAEARRLLLKQGLEVGRGRVAVLLLIGDRQDDDGALPEPADEAPLRARLQGGRGEGWGSFPLDLEVPGKPGAVARLRALYLAGAAPPAAGVRPARRIPTAGRAPARSRPRPDPWAGYRRGLPWLFALPLLMGGGLVGLALGRPAGALRRVDQGRERALLRRLGAAAPVHLKASANEPSVALDPLRQGLGDPSVVALTLPWLGPPELKAAQGYQLQVGSERKGQLLLEAGRPLDLQVLDAGGAVARGALEWRPDRRAQGILRGGLGCLALALGLALAAPLLPGLVPPPPPRPRWHAPPAFEPLCSMGAPGPLALSLALSSTPGGGS